MPSTGQKKREQVKRYDKKNSKKIREYKKKWYLKNRQRILQKIHDEKIRRQELREKIRLMRVSTY